MSASARKRFMIFIRSRAKTRIPPYPWYLPSPGSLGFIIAQSSATCNYLLETQYIVCIFYYLDYILYCIWTSLSDFCLFKRQISDRFPSDMGGFFCCWRSFRLAEQRHVNGLHCLFFGFSENVAVYFKGGSGVDMSKSVRNDLCGKVAVYQQGCVCMPLRYNKDKRKNPVFSRVSAFVVAYSIPFPTLIVNEKSVE